MKLNPSSLSATTALLCLSLLLLPSAAAPIPRVESVDLRSTVSQSPSFSNSIHEALVAPRGTHGRKSMKIPMGAGRRKKSHKNHSKKVSKIGNVGPEDDLRDGGYDGEYDAQMIFGNQTLDIQLDTGSSMLMVYSQDFIDQYQKSPGDESVRGVAFDASNSTVLKNFTCGGQECVYAYGDGSDYAFDLVQDSVSLGGFTIENQPFALAKKGSFSTPGDISGLLGLGWSTSNVGNTQSSTNSTPLVEQMWRQGLLKDPLFSFAMLRNAEQENVNWTSETKGGLFTLGELDSEQYQGDVKWKPLRSLKEGQDQPDTWSASIDSLIVNGKPLKGSEEMTALFDSGTLGMVLPKDIVRGIFSSLKEEDAPQIYQDGTVSGPCSPVGSSQVPLNLTVQYGGEEFPIDFEDIVSSRMRTEDNKLICSYAISAGDSISVLGSSFLKNVFSAFRFDPPSIGIAKLSEAFLNEEPHDSVKPSNTLTEGPAAIETLSGKWGSVKPIPTPTVSASAFQKGEPIRLSGSDLIQKTSLSLSLTPTAAGGNGNKSQASATSTSSLSSNSASESATATSSSTVSQPTLLPTSSSTKAQGKKGTHTSALTLGSLADPQSSDMNASDPKFQDEFEQLLESFIMSN